MPKETGEKRRHESDSDDSNSGHSPTKKSKKNPIREHYTQSPEPGSPDQGSSKPESPMAMAQRLSQDAIKEAFSRPATPDKPVNPVQGQGNLGNTSERNQEAYITEELHNALLPLSSTERQINVLKEKILEKLLHRDYFSYNEKYTLYENTVRYLEESPFFHSLVKEHPEDAQSALSSIDTDIQACSRLKIDLEACHKSYYHEVMEKRIQKYNPERYKLVTPDMIQTAMDGCKMYKRIVETAPNEEVLWELVNGQGGEALRLMLLGMKPVHFHVAEDVGSRIHADRLSYAELHEMEIHVELDAGDTKDSQTPFITCKDFLKQRNHLAKYCSHITNANNDIIAVETYSVFHDYDPNEPFSIPSAVYYPDNLQAMYSQRGVLQIYNTYPDLFHEELEVYNLRGPDAICDLIYRYITMPLDSTTEMTGKFGLLCGYPFYAVHEASKDEYSEKLDRLESPGREDKVPGIDYLRYNKIEDSALKEKFDILSHTSKMDSYVKSLKRTNRELYNATKKKLEETHRSLEELYDELKKELGVEKLFKESGIKSEDISKIKDEATKKIEPIDKAFKEGKRVTSNQLHEFMNISEEVEDMHEKLKELPEQLYNATKKKLRETHRSLEELYDKLKKEFGVEKLFKESSIKSEDISKIKDEATKKIKPIDKAFKEGKRVTNNQLREFMNISEEVEDMHEKLKELAEKLKKPEQQEPHSNTKSLFGNPE